MGFPTDKTKTHCIKKENIFKKLIKKQRKGSFEKKILTSNESHWNNCTSLYKLTLNHT